MRSLIVFAFLATPLAFAQTLLVLPIVNYSDSAAAAEALTRLYPGTLQFRFGGDVLLSNKNPDCQTLECLILAARKRAADYVVFSTLRKEDTALVFSSTLMRADGAAALNRSFPWTSSDEAGPLANRMADALMRNGGIVREDYRSDLRKPSRGAVTAEMGFNSLSGIYGLTGTLFVLPQVALDASVGPSLVGIRYGIRSRYLFAPTKKLSPFAFASLKYSAGTTDIDSTERDSIIVKPSEFFDFGVGLDGMANNGFYGIFCFGWSYLLGGENLRYEAAALPGPAERAVDKFLNGSGVVVSGSIGYAF